MSLFPAEGHDDLHHCGFVIDNYDFSHGKSQRGEYFSFEKKKAILRISLVRPKLDRRASTNSPNHRKPQFPQREMSILCTESRSNLRQNQAKLDLKNFLDAMNT